MSALETTRNAFVDNLADAGGRDARTEAFDAFVACGFPGRASESWKYTDTRGIEQLAIPALREPLPATELRSVRGSSPDDDPAIRFIDGRVVEIPSAPPRGMTVSPLDARPADSAANECADALRHLNAALATDVIEVAIEPGITARLDLVLDYPGDSTTLSAPRLRIAVGSGARLVLNERIQGLVHERGFSNAVISVTQAADSVLEHYRLLTSSGAINRVTSIDVELGEQADYRAFTLDTGQSLSRSETIVSLAGRGASTALDGVCLANGRQVIDHRLVAKHHGEAASSRQRYSSIAGGGGRIVFNGKVHVAAGADGTDSLQSSRNLLLGAGAEIDTRPELEIYADDVKCAHGATIGQIDADALFYLMSRGIDEPRARDLLIRAFVEASLMRISDEATRASFDSALSRALDAAAGYGS